jgi:predicted small secreted protein
MRKIICVILVLMLAFSLAACDSNNENTSLAGAGEPVDLLDGKYTYTNEEYDVSITYPAVFSNGQGGTIGFAGYDMATHAFVTLNVVRNVYGGIDEVIEALDYSGIVTRHDDYFIVDDRDNTSMAQYYCVAVNDEYVAVGWAQYEPALDETYRELADDIVVAFNR